jgi:hypothetical protein
VLPANVTMSAPDNAILSVSVNTSATWTDQEKQYDPNGIRYTIDILNGFYISTLGPNLPAQYGDLFNQTIDLMASMSIGTDWILNSTLLDGDGKIVDASNACTFSRFSQLISIAYDYGRRR